MKYKAHDYQQYATDFIIGHPVSCLILDMGLGKTVITLTALWLLLFDYFEVRRILVIAPKRVAEIKLGLWKPSELVVNLCWVDCVTHIMALTVSYECDKALRLIELLADNLYDFKVCLLIVSTYVVNPGGAL